MPGVCRRVRIEIDAMVDKNYEDTKFQGQECSALRDFRWLRIGDSAFTNLKTVRYECSTLLFQLVLRHFEIALESAARFERT